MPVHLKVGMQLLHAPSWVRCIYFLCVRWTLHLVCLTVEVDEFHLGAIDALLGEALARGKGYLCLALLLVADGHAVLVFLRAGRPEGVD